MLSFLKCLTRKNTVPTDRFLSWMQNFEPLFVHYDYTHLTAQRIWYVCLRFPWKSRQCSKRNNVNGWNYVNLTTPPPHSTPLSTSFLISQRVQQMYFDWLCLFDWLCILIDCVFSFFYMENNAEGLVVHFVLFFCLIITMKMKQLSHSSSYSKLLL